MKRRNQRKNREGKDSLQQHEQDIQRSKAITIAKNRLFHPYILPVLMYCGESLTLDKASRNKIEAVETRFYRQMIRIYWTKTKINEEVLMMVECKIKILKKVKERKAKFFEHVMRRNGLENFVTTGLVGGKKTRGRQRMKMLDGITA